MAIKKDTSYKVRDLRIASLQLGPKLSNDQIVALPPDMIDAIGKPRPSDEELSKMLRWAANEVQRLSMIVRTMMGRIYAKKKNQGPVGT